jgi:predicted pyridoxine 5'-phosphate oxidase superfamily flavin-nucleotide-binding protein
MASQSFYTAAQRQVQERFDSRRLADRLNEIAVSDRIGDDARAMIEAAPFFFLATADDDGWPDVSYKGGRPGFVRVLDERRIAFPSYDGNGMYRSLGNIEDNPRVGLLFVDLDQPHRMRLKGRAALVDDPAMVASWPGAEAAVEVAVEAVFPNCSRYLHRLELHDISQYVPAEGHRPPEPEWKAMDLFAPYLPNRDADAGPTGSGDGEAQPQR